MMNRLIGCVGLVVGLVVLTVTSLASQSAKPKVCGTGTVVDLQVREEQRPEGRQPVYTVTFRLNGTSYTAQAVGGRIAVFGPFVENARIDLCVRGETITLITPKDDEPEILTYKMNVVRRVRISLPADAS
jgi:hypothetical protein